MGAWPIEQVTVVVAATATLMLLTKSSLSALLLRRAYRILASAQMAVTRRVTHRLLAFPFFALQKGTSHEFTWLVGMGLYLTTGALLGAYAIVLSEAALLVALLLAMTVAAPVATIAAIVYFAAVAGILHRFVGRWSHRTEGRLASSFIDGQRGVQESLQLLPELLVGNRRSLYEERIVESLSRNALGMADQTYIAQLPKLVYESALVVGLVVLAGWQFATSGLMAAIGVLAVFLAAATRLMPALIRLQNSIVAVRARSANTERVQRALGALAEHDTAIHHDPFDQAAFAEGLRSGHSGFDPTIRVEDVSFTYPNCASPALAGANLTVESGQVIALVGQTGAGKTSLVSVLLGLYTPERGQVLIGGRPVVSALNRWPGAVAYVPQHVALVHGTVRDNVALGLPPELVDDKRVWMALETASLASFLRQSRDGLDTLIGEHGSHLSGGQRQRLGLARALYSDPRLLILDEATSALDAETETAVTEALLRLRGRVTIVAVAHRQATMEVADSVVQMSRGSVDFVGPFEDWSSRERSASVDLRALNDATVDGQAANN